MEITIRVEFDMGHRLPNHGGLCRNLHGHRYALELTLSGGVSNVAGAPDEGMVMDFGPVKELCRAYLKSRDHMFYVHHLDEFAPVLENLPGVVLCPYVPTAENIAAHLLEQLRDSVSRLPNNMGTLVTRLRLYETPTSWADAS